MRDDLASATPIDNALDLASRFTTRDIPSLYRLRPFPQNSFSSSPTQCKDQDGPFSAGWRGMRSGVRVPFTFPNGLQSLAWLTPCFLRRRARNQSLVLCHGGLGWNFLPWPSPCLETNNRKGMYKELHLEVRTVSALMPGTDLSGVGAPKDS